MASLDQAAKAIAVARKKEYEARNMFKMKGGNY